MRAARGVSRSERERIGQGAGGSPPRRELRGRSVRVLHVIPTLTVGGAERVVSSLARQLHRSGREVEVVALYDTPGTPIDTAIRCEGIPVTFLGKRAGLDVRMVPRIARALARFRPSVLHTHMAVLKYALPALVGHVRCRVVHTVHNLAEREAEPASRVVHAVAFRAGVVPVAIGMAVARSIERVYGVPVRHVIPNGIPVSDFAAPAGLRERTRKELGLHPGTPVFLAAGRFEPQKDHATVLRAFASPLLASIGATLLLAGDGVLRAALEQQARALCISGRVQFLGIRPDMRAILAAADGFVLPSLWEGSPLAVMEAMAAGKPIVATAVGCVPELVPDDAGRLVAPGEDRAMAEAMHAIATRPWLAEAMGAAAARTARTRFDEPKMTEAYLRLYEELS